MLIHRKRLSEAEYRGELLPTTGATCRATRTSSTSRGRISSPRSTTRTSRPGADIATTNTFTATSIGQADYALDHLAADMSRAGARLAREAADTWTARTPDRPRFVAGAVGPLNVSLSVSPKVDDPSFRSVTFDDVRASYAEQIAALAEGGVDILLVETIFDTLNAKAAIVAAADVAPELPLWLSFTAIDRSGRNLSGQTSEAFWVSVEHARPLIVGVNCSLGATEMRPFLEGLARVADTYVVLLPERRAPERDGRARRATRRYEPVPARVRRGRSRQPRRRLLRDDAGARQADRGGGRGHRSAATSPPVSRERGGVASSRSRSARTRGS